MPSLSAAVMQPRKQPVQARSTATVDAILEATLQVLITDGKALTTTRIAHRAGVSVGTIYQYFPNKRSLLQSVLKRHLGQVTDAVVAACEEHRGRPLVELVTAVANTFFTVKMRNPKAGLALYSISSDVDGLRVTEQLRVGIEQAWLAALRSAPERLSGDLELISFTLQSAMTGLARRLLEAKVPTRQHDALRVELVRMLCAYVDSLVVEPASPKSKRRA